MDVFQATFISLPVFQNICLNRIYSRHESPPTTPSETTIIRSEHCIRRTCQRMLNNQKALPRQPRSNYKDCRPAKVRSRGNSFPPTCFVKKTAHSVQLSVPCADPYVLKAGPHPTTSDISDNVIVMQLSSLSLSSLSSSLLSSWLSSPSSPSEGRKPHGLARLDPVRADGVEPQKEVNQPLIWWMATSHYCNICSATSWNPNVHRQMQWYNTECILHR